jgi:hypothetical protein
MLEALRYGWLLVGLIALFYTVRKYTDARADLVAQLVSGEDGAFLYSVKWSIRAARLSVAIALTMALAPLAAIFNALGGAPIVGSSPSVFTIISIMALAAGPVLFTLKQWNDVRSRTQLTRILRKAAITSGVPK